jgi:outer membrane immunogenic protein
MKKALFAASAIALALSAGTALAADLSSRKGPPEQISPPPVVTWTGFYGGLDVGGGWSANNNADSLLPFIDPETRELFLLPGSGRGSNSSGGLGGGQIGYNYQFSPMFVVGAEADFQGASISYSSSNSVSYSAPASGNTLIPLLPNNGIVAVGLRWFGTVRGRAGFLLMPSLLIYGTAGFAYGDVLGDWTGYGNTRTGWTAGGGVEWMFVPNWSAKLEYLFMDLDSGGTTGSLTGHQWGTHVHPEYNLIRAGVNCHFNWGAPAPVVAKY